MYLPSIWRNVPVASPWAELRTSLTTSVLLPSLNFLTTSLAGTSLVWTGLEVPIRVQTVPGVTTWEVVVFGASGLVMVLSAPLIPTVA